METWGGHLAIHASVFFYFCKCWKLYMINKQKDAGWKGWIWTQVLLCSASWPLLIGCWQVPADANLSSRYGKVIPSKPVQREASEDTAPGSTAVFLSFPGAVTPEHISGRCQRGQNPGSAPRARGPQLPLRAERQDSLGDAMLGSRAGHVLPRCDSSWE